MTLDDLIAAAQQRQNERAEQAKREQEEREKRERAMWLDTLETVFPTLWPFMQETAEHHQTANGYYYRTTFMIDGETWTVRQDTSGEWHAQSPNRAYEDTRWLSSNQYHDIDPEEELLLFIGDYRRRKTPTEEFPF